MVRRIAECSALIGTALMVSVTQGCDSSTSSQAEAANEALANGDSALTAGAVPIEGAFNIDLGYQLNVVSGDYVHKNLQGLLFSDGWVLKKIPQLHLDDFDVQTSRQDDIGQWGEWRSEGDAISIRWYDRDGAPKDWKTYENWFMFENPAAGEVLEGTYKTLDVSSSSTGSREFFATGWSVVTFDENGAFAETSGGSTTVGASDQSTTDDNSSLVTANSDSSKGSYQITDSDIEFTFDDGTKRENSIFYSSSEKKIIFINGVQFIRG